jgi:hypothetical protein
MISYQNGNTFVSIFEGGTKTRTYEGSPSIIHPESIDVKITDYCDMNCEYCHESSTVKGFHGDLNKLLSVISHLPAGVELAIGGGNPLSHPQLIEFLTALKAKGIIANITINQGHLKKYQELIEFLISLELVKGVGISITSNNFTYIKPLVKLTNNIVFHVIAGVNDVSVIERLIRHSPEGNCKVLILGYKQFGFGLKFYNPEVEANIKRWFMYLPQYLNKAVLSFDNLGIEQLNVKRFFTESGWSKFYMGDDFCFTMYIDAVKQEFAPTSRSKFRKSFETHTLEKFFELRNPPNEYQKTKTSF